MDLFTDTAAEFSGVRLTDLFLNAFEFLTVRLDFLVQFFHSGRKRNRQQNRQRKSRSRLCAHDSLFLRIGVSDHSPEHTNGKL